MHSYEYEHLGADVPDVAPLPEWAQARKDAGLCALIAGRCVTHDVPDTAAHHFATHRDDGRVSGFAAND